LIITLATLLLVAMAPAVVMAAGGQFTDDDDSIFEADIEWLAGAGVTAGCNPPTNDNFCPNDNVKRGQMAAFMRRFAQYIGAEDGTPALADSALEADFAINAGTVDGLNGNDLQPALFAFEGDIDKDIGSSADHGELGSVMLSTTEILFCRYGAPNSDILVRASGTVTELDSGEYGAFFLTDAAGVQIPGTLRWVGEPWGSFAMEWYHNGDGGNERFGLEVTSSPSHTFEIRDAQITAEIIRNTRCSVSITLDEPTGEISVSPEGS
jgi:hypothetical protein